MEIRGRFEAGAFVAVANPDGTELARGLSQFSSSELSRIRGLGSAEAARTLGQTRSREVIHRNHLVLAREFSKGQAP